MRKQVVVAIDGPAGAGKSTAARLLAGRLGCLYIDSGALYRAATLGCMQRGVDLEDAAAVEAAVGRMAVRYLPEGVYLDGRKLGGEIRAEEVTRKVRHLAANPAVRRMMTRAARDSVRDRDAVVEGRDAGGVIFPDARVKVYLDASVEERARRRGEELRNDGQDLTPSEVIDSIASRDRSDFSRADDPLGVAPGAAVVDTTELTIEEVVGKLEELVKQKVGEQDE